MSYIYIYIKEYKKDISRTPVVTTPKFSVTKGGRVSDHVDPGPICPRSQWKHQDRDRVEDPNVVWGL